MRLETFDGHGFDRGRSRWVEGLWLLVAWLFVSSWLPGSGLRAFWLRLFGARIGKGVRIKPGVRVKFPWRLVVGDHVWLGEGVWIDNLAPVTVGDNCCVSQDAYLCTGSHDWSRDDFALRTAPITLEDRSWIGARAVVAPGVTVRQGAVLALGAVALSDLDSWSIYQGNPASLIRARRIASDSELQG